MTASPDGGQALAAVLDRVTAAVAGAVPGLSADDARGLVARAASRRGALRQLGRHLAACPDALASGSADAPLAVIALAGLLAGEGYPGVRVPACAGCGAVTVLRHHTEGGRLCDTCDRRSRHEPCAGCGRDRIVNTRTLEGPLCCSCAQPRGECAACGQVRRVAARRRDGAALCKMCHRSPAEPCVTCGQVAAVAARTRAGPVCKACYTSPARACGECGQQRSITRRATGDQPDLCQRCAARPLDTCAACGQQRRCSRRAGMPVCEDCRRAGDQPDPPGCPGPDPRAERARRTARARRVLPGRLTALLAEPGHGVPVQLEPLIAALVSTPAPSSVLDWVSRRSGAQLLADLAVRARCEPVSHQLLDTYPQTLALHHLRGVLVHAGVLPEREEYLDRIEPWLDQLLASCPPSHTALIRPFATWHILRRARGQARHQDFTPSAGRWARSHILAAVQFLAWLDQRGAALADATQADIDAWLDHATQHRYLVRAFTQWAVARRLAARASSAWELAALAWLVLLAVPLAFIDVAVRRLPDPLTAAALAGTLALLAVAALAGHLPGHLGRAAIGAVALAGFYLVLAVIRPGGLGLGDAKLAASVGAALGWISWQALPSGTFTAFALAGLYSGALALHRATRTSHLPLGPFILLGTLAAIAL